MWYVCLYSFDITSITDCVAIWQDWVRSRKGLRLRWFYRNILLLLFLPLLTVNNGITYAHTPYTSFKLTWLKRREKCGMLKMSNFAFRVIRSYSYFVVYGWLLLWTMTTGDWGTGEDVLLRQHFRLSVFFLSGELNNLLTRSKYLLEICKFNRAKRESKYTRPVSYTSIQTTPFTFIDVKRWPLMWQHFLPRTLQRLFHNKFYLEKCRE